jgi:hypothetical protein
MYSEDLGQQIRLFYHHVRLAPLRCTKWLLLILKKITHFASNRCVPLTSSLAFARASEAAWREN